MTEDVNELKLFLNKAVKQEFLPQLFTRINSHKQFLTEIVSLTDKYPVLIDNLSISSEHSSITNITELNKLILEKLESRFHLNNNDSLLLDLKSFSISLSSFISETEEKRIEVQARERFYFQTGDSILLRILKIFKRLFFKASSVPVQIKNIFLKLLKKPVHNITYWNHKIPLRNLRSIYLLSALYLKLSELYIRTLSVQTSSLLALKNYNTELENIFCTKLLNAITDESSTDNSENIKTAVLEAIETIDDLNDEFNKNSEEIIEKIIVDYADAYIRADTIELRSAQLSNSKVMNAEKEFSRLYNRLEKGWGNTLFALADDWRMDNELYTTRYKLILEYKNTIKTVSEKLDNNVIPLISSIKDAVSKVKKKFDNSNFTFSELNDLLIKSRSDLQSELNEKLIPRVIEIILEQEILTHIDLLETDVQKIISELPEKRALVKTDVYDKELKDSDISYVSLRDMTTYSSLPKFISVILKSKATQSLNLQKIQNYLLEIDQISDFSIDSAQIMLQKEKGNIEQIKQVVVEGLERANKKVDDINEQVIKLKDSFSQNIQEPLNQLNDDLISLTFTDSIFELKLKIAKDRALQKSREFRTQAIKKIKSALPRLFLLLKEAYQRVTQIYTKTKKLIGFEKSATSVKGEVSNFLSETDNAINKLPFVYQRLFVVEPIEDIRFFFGRDKELTKLEQSYQNWIGGKFSPTVIFGEKGSGATSLMNIFIKNNQLNDSLIKIFVRDTACTKELFFSLFKDALQINKNIELNELIGFLNDKTLGKKIIFLENIQHLYLRKINGFENLKLLFELISKTNENVFWITTCTIYSYKYLQKAISISEYFANQIELENLDDKQMIDIIVKRHRVSGYDLYFEASEADLSNKNFLKLSEEERQVEVEKNYFSLLNKFADSNISLALLFWLRSTSSISEGQITIGHLPKIDFSFLSSSSNDRIFVLNLLLIHDGLSIEDLSSINNISKDQNRRLLITMADDGIIMDRGNLYLINPLLYRPIVQVLKSKNIIHY